MADFRQNIGELALSHLVCGADRTIRSAASAADKGVKHFYGEFDPGSERTLAAWIRHASRTGA